MRRRTSSLALLSLVALATPPAQAQWSTQSLQEARRVPAAVSVGDLAFFAGGEAGGTSIATVDIYDDASGTWSVEELSSARSLVAATAVGNYVLFAGGALNGTTLSDVVDVFDLQTMTWGTPGTLSLERAGASATTVGSKAIFAGGGTGSYQSPIPSDVVDVYDASIGPPSDPAAWLDARRGVGRG